MDSNLLAERRLREYGWYWLLHADRLGVRSALSQKHPELPRWGFECVALGGPDVRAGAVITMRP